MARWAVVLLCLAGCDKLFGLVRVDDGVDAQTGEAGSLQCPTSYDLRVTGSTTFYRYVSAEIAWTTAQQRCESDSTRITHLVVLSDDNERTGLVEALAQRQVTSTFWIGLSDRTSENQFKWVTAEPVGMPPRQNPPWPAGQPDNANSAQDCVRIQGAETIVNAGLFDDAECPGMFDYVCECDGYASAPANY